MSVLSRPRHAHPTTAPAPGTGTTAGVPQQRSSDRLQPWSPGPSRPQPARTRQDGRRRAALVLAGLAAAGAAGAGLLVAEPWEDGPAAIRPATTADAVTTTDQLRDDAAAGRAGSGAGPGATDVQRDAVLQQRGSAGG